LPLIKGKSASSSGLHSKDPQWDKITCKVVLNWKKRSMKEIFCPYKYFIVMPVLHSVGTHALPGGLVSKNRSLTRFDKSIKTQLN